MFKTHEVAFRGLGAGVAAVAMLLAAGPAAAAPPVMQVEVTNFPAVQTVQGTVGIDPAQNVVKIDAAQNAVTSGDVTVELAFLAPTTIPPGGNVIHSFDATGLKEIRVFAPCQGPCTETIVTVYAIRTMGALGHLFALQPSTDLNSFFSQAFSTPGGEMRVEIQNAANSDAEVSLLVLGRAN